MAVKHVGGGRFDVYEKQKPATWPYWVAGVVILLLILASAGDKKKPSPQAQPPVTGQVAP